MAGQKGLVSGTIARTVGAYIDKSTLASTGIDYAHHEVHAGSYFHLITYSDDLASGSTINISLLTPNTTKECHVLWLFDSSGEYLNEVLSGSTITGGGAATPANAHKGSSTASQMVCLTGVTVSADGTLIYRRYVASGKNVGVQSRATDERILAPNTQYVFRLTSKTASSKSHIELGWYEHTPKIP